MAENHTYYHQTLTMLYHRVYPDYALDDNNFIEWIPDDMHERFEKLKTIYHIAMFSLFLKNELTQCETNILINRDYDIDYEYWASEKTWGLNMKDGAGWSEIEGGFSQSNAEMIARYLPEAPAHKNYDNAIPRDIIIKALNMLASPYMCERTLNTAIKEALTDMVELLKQCEVALHRKRTSDEYATLSNWLYLAYSSQPDLAKPYKKLKEHFDEPSFEWLEEQLIKELKKLALSPFMQAIIHDIPAKSAANSKIIYSLDKIDLDTQHRFYKVLSSFCTYSANRFVFSEKLDAVGHAIYKYQDVCHNQEYNSFYQFRFMVNLIQQDLDLLPPIHKANRIHPITHPQLNRSFMTFKTNGINSGHITLFYQKLMDFNWIPKDTDANEFLKLFSGKTCVCKIKWLGGGKGNLKELFRLMKEQQLITIPGGHGLDTVLENHFTDESGSYLTGINSGKYANKALPDIYKCIEVLHTNIDREEDDYSY